MNEWTGIAMEIGERVLAIILGIVTLGIISIVPYLLTKRLIKYALEYYFHLKRLNKE